MIFSMHTDQHVKDAVDIFGYAYGYNRICKHFGEFSYRNKTMELVQNSPKSQVQMFYMEPEWYNLKNMQNLRHPTFNKFYDHQYKIYGTHLEATRVWSHWIESMNKVDEIWVGNQFAADAVVNSGITTPTYVFEHGIDDMWMPKKRGQNSKIRFLHVDSASPRKRADLVEKAFKKLFYKNPNVELTLKFHTHDSPGQFAIPKFDENITKIFATLSQDEMVQLFYEHDVLVYPSEGEGFGFIPLQALATGMPVISTGRWCSYEKYLGSNVIESTIGPTKHTGYSEGEVVLADFDSLVNLMSSVYKDIDNQCNFYYQQAPKVYKEYNWANRCNLMLKSFIKRVGIGMLSELEDVEEDQVFVYYTGSGSYALLDDIRFDSNKRLQAVEASVASNLLSLECFIPGSDLR